MWFGLLGEGALCDEPKQRLRRRLMGYLWKKQQYISQGQWIFMRPFPLALAWILIRTKQLLSITANLHAIGCMHVYRFWSNHYLIPIAHVTLIRTTAIQGGHQSHCHSSVFIWSASDLARVHIFDAFMLTKWKAGTGDKTVEGRGWGGVSSGNRLAKLWRLKNFGHWSVSRHNLLFS